MTLLAKDLKVGASVSQILVLGIQVLFDVMVELAADRKKYQGPKVRKDGQGLGLVVQFISRTAQNVVDREGVATCLHARI